MTYGLSFWLCQLPTTTNSSYLPSPLRQVLSLLRSARNVSPLFESYCSPNTSIKHDFLNFFPTSLHQNSYCSPINSLHYWIHQLLLQFMIILSSLRLLRGSWRIWWWCEVVGTYIRILIWGITNLSTLISSSTNQTIKPPNQPNYQSSLRATNQIQTYQPPNL